MGTGAAAKASRARRADCPDPVVLICFQPPEACSGKPLFPKPLGCAWGSQPRKQMLFPVASALSCRRTFGKAPPVPAAGRRRPWLCADDSGSGGAHLRGRGLLVWEQLKSLQRAREQVPHLDWPRL